MPMTTNPFKQALAAGQVQIGTWLNLARNPAILPLLQGTGLDYARIDMEHSSPSIETVADMAVLARALGFPITVRPPEANREWITRLLDVGVWSLHLPQVDTPAIARSIVEAARYAPVGMRGMAVNGPHNDFAAQTPLGDVNDQVHLTIMLESKEAFDHLDEIVATPGIDAVTLGPSDLAQELGVLGTPEEARVIDEHRDRLIDAAKRHGKDVALLCSSVEQARHWMDAGVKIIAFASDVAMLQRAYGEVVSQLRA